MKIDKKFLTTLDVINIIRAAGIPLHDFINAVKSGEISPCWDDGAPLDLEDITVALNEIEKAKNAN